MYWLLIYLGCIAITNHITIIIMLMLPAHSRCMTNGTSVSFTSINILLLVGILWAETHLLLIDSIHCFLPMAFCSIFCLFVATPHTWAYQFRLCFLTIVKRYGVKLVRDSLTQLVFVDHVQILMCMGLSHWSRRSLSLRCSSAFQPSSELRYS